MDRPDMTGQYQQMAMLKPLNLLEGEVVCYNMKIPNWS